MTVPRPLPGTTGSGFRPCSRADRIRPCRCGSLLRRRTAPGLPGGPTRGRGNCPRRHTGVKWASSRRSPLPCLSPRDRRTPMTTMTTSRPAVGAIRRARRTDGRVAAETAVAADVLTLPYQRCGRPRPAGDSPRPHPSTQTGPGHARRCGIGATADLGPTTDRIVVRETAARCERFATPVAYPTDRTRRSNLDCRR